ncbi:MAG: baseplate J/gp47 family protein [Candidatus Kaiserbacteria bacterium]|nr:baseplate J/gp47 family protein [Candidatus Kaiserbacteria bacterium]
MADDYFKDILPKSGSSRNTVSAGAPQQPSFSSAERSIRNITVSPRHKQRVGSSDMREMREPPSTPSFASSGPSKPLGKRVWIWIIAAVSVLVLIIIAIFFFRSTTVTVTPRSHAVVFDSTSNFVAYPIAEAATGTLAYSVSASDLEDSAVVKSEGKEHAEEKATGTIEVFNEYGTGSIRLIKNTRFVTESGLVFRVPATVVVPGKKGTKPGSVAITVFADQAGVEYNVGPSRFTLPGLKSSPDMYAKVYGRSSAAMSGGFVGDRPAIAPATLESARAEIRGRLESKARDTADSLANDTSVVFPGLVKITYESLPITSEAGGDVRLHEKAHVEVPVFTAESLAQVVALAAGANVGNEKISLSGMDKAKAVAKGASVLGKDTLAFALNGGAVIVWNVDSGALAQALAGRDNSAFQGIVNGFPGIQEARARIEPFWKGSFPASPSDIKIELVPVESAK